MILKNDKIIDLDLCLKNYSCWTSWKHIGQPWRIVTKNKLIKKKNLIGKLGIRIGYFL